MKILYSCLSKSWGGLEMFTITAVKQLLNRDVKVELLCSKESRIHIEASGLGLIIHPIKASGYFHPFSTLKLISIIRRGNYDFVHTQASKDLWLLVPALKILRKEIPLILTKQMGSFIIKKDFLHKWIYKRVNLTFAISRVIEKNLIETTPLSKDKIILMHNGINLTKFNPQKVDRNKIRNEFKINENELLFGMIARFSPGKGHEEFLYAVKELNKKFTNLKVLIVGEASQGEDEYAAKIRKLNEEYLLSNVIFTGFRSDIAELLAAMDIFVFPSHSEAFGIVLAEAMAMGKPSVCANSDGILDIAVDGETSLLFERKNGNDLKEKLDMLIADPAKREKFGKAARKRAMNNFDLEASTDKTLNIYKNLLNLKNVSQHK